MALRMLDGKPFYDWFLCDRPFQFGDHVYDGRHIRQWDIQLCRFCVAGNWDGIVLETHPRLAEHLRERQIPFQLNDKGWLDIPVP